MSPPWCWLTTELPGSTIALCHLNQPVFTDDYNRMRLCREPLEPGFMKVKTKTTCHSKISGQLDTTRNRRFSGAQLRMGQNGNCKFRLPSRSRWVADASPRDSAQAKGNQGAQRKIINNYGIYGRSNRKVYLKHQGIALFY